MRPLTALSFSVFLGACASPSIRVANGSRERDLSICGPEIRGIDAVRDSPVVLLGEMHGLAAPPAFAADLACRLAAGGESVLLAVEIPNQEQPRIDVFLASAGAESDKVRLLRPS
jgi:hypothetical protein